jgi:hypothetical protein
MPAAFAVGSTFFLVAVILVAGEIARARGGGTNSAAAVVNVGPVVDLPPAAAFAVPGGSNRPQGAQHVRRKSTLVARIGGGGSAGVCVRLCDGFFFPSALVGEGDEGCAEQCPDAPTAFYSKPAGSDGVVGAVSVSGAPYSDLPVADRHLTAYDGTCTCHRSLTRSHVAELLQDRTLRNGDLVMTEKGFTVFRGDKSGAVSASNFVALSRSSTVSKEARAELTAMEHAGDWDRQSGPYSSPASVEATEVAPRLRRGTVTVDDSDATRTH